MTRGLIKFMLVEVQDNQTNFQNVYDWGFGGTSTVLLGCGEFFFYFVLIVKLVMNLYSFCSVNCNTMQATSQILSVIHHLISWAR